MASGCQLTLLDSAYFHKMALHCLTVIAIPTHLFGAYCILFRTPPRMTSVKWSLLNLHFWTSSVDLALNFFTIPFIVVPILGGYPLGLLSMTRISTKDQTYAVVTAIAVMAFAIVGIFENRYYVLNLENRWWSRLRVPLFMINYTIALLFFYPVYSRIPVDQKAAVDSALKMLPCLPEDVKAIDMFIASESPRLFLCLLATGLAYVITQTVIFYQLISQRFKRHGYKLSAKTLTMQKKLMRALVLQMLLPLIILIFPLTYCSTVMLLEYHNQALNNISFIIISSHGIFSTIAMILMHSPYRQVVLNGFRKLENN